MRDKPEMPWDYAVTDGFEDKTLVIMPTSEARALWQMKQENEKLRAAAKVMLEAVDNSSMVLFEDASKSKLSYANACFTQAIQTFREVLKDG